MRKFAPVLVIPSAARDLPVHPARVLPNDARTTPATS